MAFTGTPAAEAVERIVRQEFGSALLRVGQYNRRKIAGTNIWSQHSWGNALDLHVSVGTAQGAQKDNGDAIADFLKANRTLFGIKAVIWWTTSHYDHIHVDFWPKGHGTPPLSSTGVGQFRYSNNIIVNEQIQKVPAEGSFTGYDPPEYEEETVLQRGDEGLAVADVQAALIAKGYDLGAWPPYSSDHPVGADGDFGSATEAGVRAEQQRLGLTESGVADGVFVAFVLEPVASAPGLSEADVKALINDSQIVAG